LGFAASPKDLVCWNVLCESGNMTKQSESSLANDGRGCQETGPAYDFIAKYEIVPSDVKYPPLTPCVKVH